MELLFLNMKCLGFHQLFLHSTILSLALLPPYTEAFTAGGSMEEREKSERGLDT